MKIIGKVNNDTYLAEVSHVEVEKVFDKYYGNLQKFGVGEIISLSDGYDFRSDIKAACLEMATATKQFEKSQAALFKFALMVANIPEELAKNKSSEAAK